MPLPAAGTSAEERPDASEGVEGAVVVDDAAIDPGPERARGRALEGVSIRSAVQAIDAANAGGGSSTRANRETARLPVRRPAARGAVSNPAKWTWTGKTKGGLTGTTS